MKKTSLILAGTLVLVSLVLPTTTAFAATSSANTTINTTVNSTIAVASNGTVGMSVSPGASPLASSASDSVRVSTNATAGYTLALRTSTATQSLTKGTDTIAASANATASPAALAVNTWGFRVDGQGTFGAGPTTTFTNQTISGTWAGVPTADYTIRSTSTVANNEATTVWYAMNVDSTKPNGTYTNTVVYTATTKN